MMLGILIKVRVLPVLRLVSHSFRRSSPHSLNKLKKKDSSLKVTGCVDKIPWFAIFHS